MDFFHNPVFYALPFFFLLLLAEVWFDSKRRNRVYEWKDTWTSLSLGLGSVFAEAVWQIPWVLLMHWIWMDHRLWDFQPSWWSFLILVLLDDFSYYWYHRASHRVPILWAAHVTHHSTEHYHFATALRQPWTTGWHRWFFWLPQVWLGFPPAWVFTAFACNLIYQYWIHTQFIGKLGKFEWILNTPSHHRVHHGRNDKYVDRNFGGVLIIWDRLFGSFEPEVERVKFGLKTPVGSHNPLWLNLHGYFELFAAARRETRISDRLKILLRGPEGVATARRTPRVGENRSTFFERKKS